MLAEIIEEVVQMPPNTPQHPILLSKIDLGPVANGICADLNRKRSRKDVPVIEIRQVLYPFLDWLRIGTSLEKTCIRTRGIALPM